MNRKTTTIDDYLLSERSFLLGSAEFEEFLYDVIAEHVCHETVRGGHDFRKHQLFLRDRGSLQFLLNEARSVLVLGELDDVILNVA